MVSLIYNYIIHECLLHGAQSAKPKTSTDPITFRPEYIQMHTNINERTTTLSIWRNDCHTPLPPLDTGLCTLHAWIYYWKMLLLLTARVERLRYFLCCIYVHKTGYGKWKEHGLDLVTLLKLMVYCSIAFLSREIPLWYVLVSLQYKNIYNIVRAFVWRYR